MKGTISPIQHMEIANLQIAYGQERPVIYDVSLKFPKGKILLISGASGSGKSTLLRCLAGLLPVAGGSYRINDQAVEDLSFEEFLPLRMSIGYSFDMGGLLNNRSLRENLGLHLQYHKIWDSEAIEREVSRRMVEFDFARVSEGRPSAVSGSQRKACCVARALIHKPSVLILDDPTTGLGEKARRALHEELRLGLQNQSLNFVVAASEEKSFFADLPHVAAWVDGRRLFLEDQVMEKSENGRAA